MVFVIFLVLMWNSILCAEPVFTVRMKGGAEGVGLATRKAAIENAQHLVMIDVLQSMTNSEDSSIFSSILAKASSYIQRYELLRSDVVGQTTEVEIDAYVLEKPLRHDIAAIMLPRLPRKPSVRLLMGEYIGLNSEAGGPTFSIAEEVLKSSLEEFGFGVAGIHDLLDHFELPQLLTIIQGDVPTTAAFARAIDQDVLVVGTVTVAHEYFSPGSNMLRHRARAVVRILSGRDGKVYDTLTAEAAVQSVSPEEGGAQAVQDAAGKLAGECIVAVVLAALGMEGDSRVIVQIEFPGSEVVYNEITQRVRAIVGVTHVEQLLFSETMARIAVEYDGTMAHFSDMLTGGVSDGRKVEVTRCVRREITVMVR